MEQANIKGIPYGVANFEQVRKENLYYVDKTMYLPLLEEASNYLFLIRPGADIEAMLTEIIKSYTNVPQRKWWTRTSVPTTRS